MRAPLVVRWPGHIEPGTVKNEMFASLDWLPTLVDIAGGPKDNELKAQIEQGAYPGHRQDHARRRQPARLPGRRRETSARDTFFYYSGKDPSAVRYKNWKMYFAMVADAPAGFLDRGGPLPLDPGRQHQARSVRDLGRRACSKTLFGQGGALAGPLTAYVYDWNMLPIGQALWLRELETYIDFPPMQDPASYNLEQVIAAGSGNEVDASRGRVDPNDCRRPTGGACI